MMYYGLLQISLFIGSCALPKGREFVAAFPEMYYQGFFPEISFVILSDVNTTVHIESKGFNISEDVDVQAMVEHRYSADSLFYYKANLEVTDMTFSVSSGTDITLFCYNAMVHRGDGYVALPIIDLATKYIVVTHIDNHTSNTADINLPYTGQSHTVLLIVATEDATQVDVSLNIKGPLMAGGCGGGTFFNGETRTFTLNKYQIVGAYCSEDITGTLVTSDKPVAVLSGHNTKRFSGSSNLLLEMLLPVKSFGRSFVLPEPPTITGGAVYRVVGSEATTTVRSPSGTSFSLGEGEYLDIDVNSTTGSLYIEADRPVSVVQFTQKLASMAIVPPTSLFADDYDISKPVFNPTYDLHSAYLTVIVPTDKVIGLRPQIFPQFTVIKGSCFSVASVELRTGFYRLLHVDGVPFGGMMYLKPNWGNIGIFTHPIGYNLTDDTVKLGCSSSGICSDGTPYPCSCSKGYFVYQCDDSSAGCNNDPCHYNSSCEDLDSTYICDCVNGSGGAHCEIDIYNHCENNTCVNGTCVDEIGAFSCNCTDGFTGEYCETNINECAHGPCVHGTCMDGINNYTCICEPGYTDLDCSTDIDDCATVPCQNGGICHDFVNYFNCSCTPGFIGLLCEIDMDECSSNPCVNGTCSDQPNMYKCTCTPGYEGVNCDEEINECATSLCVHGTCVDHVNKYTCICEPGYTDWNCSTDIDECATNPCVNGTCVDHVNNYTCACEPGYTDMNCSTEINECATSLCVHGTCVDHVNNYTCICEPGYTDWNCSADIDECATNPCVNGACVDHVNNYTCACEPGYTDMNCSTDIDECATNPCVNGACVDHVNNYTCDCEPGYTDGNCSTDIDECFSNPCVNGNCSDLLNMYDCTCTPGYDGINCDTDIDDCLNGPCRNGGTCIDFTNSYNCSCVPGFEGTDCETAIDACAGNPCQNSGTCTQSSGGFTCSCPAGFMGDTCQTDIDDCASKPCQNEGTCTDRINAFECLCPANFSGLLCNILMSCTCPCRLNSSIDSNELAAKIKWLKALLTVDKSKLSSALRKKISVPDERPSASGIGFSGICCLVAAFGFFLIMDCINVIQFLTRQKDPEKTLNVK